MNGRIRHVLYLELHHLRSRLCASAPRDLLDVLEPVRERVRETARRSAWGLRLGLDALREDLGWLCAGVRAAPGSSVSARRRRARAPRRRASSSA